MNIFEQFLDNLNEILLDLSKKGDLISGEVKLNKKRSVNLPEGQWEVYYRSTEHAAGMKFSMIDLGKIEDNQISEFFSIT